MNILTFDIEEWYIEKVFGGGRQSKYDEFDTYLNQILDLLDERRCKATFFCVGKMAVDFPEVVQRIAERGHEIGCHSNIHTWLDKMAPEEALRDTKAAVESLEQCVGKKVLSYRAPAFSIGDSNKWAFEILAECGIAIDASVFPASRDFGGFPEFGHQTPVLVTYHDMRIKEFPICTTKILGKEIAYSGGGYFRFFPLWLVRREMARNDYSMTYFHIGDLVPEQGKVLSRKAYEDYFKENGSAVNRYKRYFKTNFGRKNAFDKLKRLIRSTDFVNLEQADSILDWNMTETVNL